MISSAHIDNFPDSPLPPAINVAGRHSQLCGPDELTLFNYPADVPLADREPDVAAATGAPPPTCTGALLLGRCICNVHSILPERLQSLCLISNSYTMS